MHKSFIYWICKEALAGVKNFICCRSLDMREDQGGLTEVTAGIIASSMSFGYVQLSSLSLVALYIQIFNNFSFREFIGPVIGGALVEMMDFQTAAVVSC